jgi:hypothetical protein
MGKYVKTKIGFNKTQIKDGHIVRLDKNGTVKAILDTWPPKERRAK